MASDRFGRAAQYLLLGTALLNTVACYAYQVPTTPSPAGLTGEQVVLDLTDDGRTALAQRIGPGVLHAYGRLTAATDTSYTLAMSRTEQSRGFGTPWAGELVTFAKRDVGTVRLRRFHGGRTALAAAAAAGVFGAFILTRELVGNGGLDGGTGPTPPPADQ